MKLLIIDNFDSFTYNMYQYCAELGVIAHVVKNNELTLEQIRDGNYSHIIISPGPGSPDNEKDFGVCEQVILTFTNTPILGVCLGHQGIVHALGGNVIRAPKPMHGKTSNVTLNTTSKIFDGMPPTIEVMRYHSLLVDKETLPKELKIISETKEDGLIMGIEHTLRPLWGVQFHPESIGTLEGITILKNFLAQ